MFWWRRKDQGFEWHDYVRTTILVRRHQRREKFEEARREAVENVAELGRRGQEAARQGVDSARRGLGGAAAAMWAAAVPFGRRLAAGARLALGSIARGAGAALVYLLGLVWSLAGRGRDAAAQTGSEAGRAAWRSIKVMASDLADRGFGLPLRKKLALPAGVVAVFAAGGAAGEFLTGGVTLFAGLAFAVAFAFGAYAYACARSDDDGDVIPDFDDVVSWFRESPLVGARVVRPVLWIVSVLGVGLFFFSGLNSDGEFGSDEGAPSSARSAASAISGDVVGYARSLSGDTLRIGKTIVKLSGIEAPELSQKCKLANGRTWSCGSAALQALRRITGSHRVACVISGSTVQGKEATCSVGKLDLARELVEQGHVFAVHGLFSRYGSAEARAQENRRGIWRGESMRPGDYRDQAWKSAAQKAPDGCPIKGRALGASRKVYLMPWSKKYGRYRIRTSRGDRWFCSEQEAVDAGWKPLGRT